MTRKRRSEERLGYIYDSGLEIARQLGEEAISVASPTARFLMVTASITQTLDLDFVKKATFNQLINDTLEKIRKESDIITVERMISAIVSGKYKDHIEETTPKIKEVSKELEEEEE